MGKTDLSRHLRPRTGAFTVVELVVVMVCVGLLVGIFQPSLSEAISRSRQLGCIERLHKIGQATLAYSEYDPSSAALPVHGLQNRQNPSIPTFIGAYEWGGKSGIGRQTYTGLPGIHGSKFGTAAGFGPATRPLNKILYPSGFVDNGSQANPPFGPSQRIGAELDTRLELDVYRCPADDGPPGGAHCQDWLQSPRRSSFDHFGTSYAANLFMIQSGGGGGSMASNSPYLRPLSGVPNPARTLSFEENIGRFAWVSRREIAGCEWSTVADPGPTKAVRGWHGKDWIYNRSFVDGHAERQKVYMEGTEDADGYANHYRNEQLSCYPVMMCPTQSYDCNPGELGFEQFRCVIIRGDGWQKDTMPAPLICAGLSYPCSGRPSFDCCVPHDSFPRSDAPSSQFH